ncbi:MAG TPA: hypothetical protein VFQ65_32660 [Kofleriaceae bacterium]|nr:hypothetical protein [Kofleriaceae bacterium]
MTYRNDVDALEARKTALEFEVEQKTRERDLAAMLLHEAKARAKLPILDNIRVATPCSADWNEMVGDDRVRHCMKCDKDVFNLSQMTRDDAEQLLREKQGNLCARYFQRSDGTIITSDCAIGKQQRRRRRVVAASAAALLAGGAAFTWKLMNHEPAVSVDEDVRIHAGGLQIQGGISAPPIQDDVVEIKGDIGPPITAPTVPPPTAYLGRVSGPVTK